MDRYEKAAAALSDVLLDYGIPADILVRAAVAAVDASSQRLEHEKAEEVLALLREGVPYAKIAERTGVPETTCFNIAAKHGLKRGRKPNVAVKWTDEMRDTLRGMRNAGISLPVIGKRLGITADSVKKECHRQGMKRTGRKVVRSDGRVILHHR